MNLKIVRLAVLLPLAASGAIKAVGQTGGDPQTEYAKAVKTYLDAATEQLKAVRNGLDAQLKDASEEVKARFRKTYEGLDQSDALLERLKNARTVDFDRIKADFELVRTQAFKELEIARKG